MASEKLQILLDLILKKYKSLERPEFFFIRETEKLRPYDDLVHKMRKIFNVKEETDINYDVSFRYLVSRVDDQWLIQLSMLGPYAVVMGVRDGPSEIVEPDSVMGEEKEIVNMLLQNKIEVLSEDILEQRVVLRLANTEVENVRIYQALFSDTDMLPWE